MPGLFIALIIAPIFMLKPGVLAMDKTEKKHVDIVRDMRFLISVNDTWAGPNGCLATVATPPIPPNKLFNESIDVQVGNCDHGPLTYIVSESAQRNSKYTVTVTFYSSVIEDASPPTCSIGWNASYRIPETYDPKESLLPGCFLKDSREGYHMTYYWFHLLSWNLQ